MGRLGLSSGGVIGSAALAGPRQVSASGTALVDRVGLGVEGLLERLHSWFSLGRAVGDSTENCIVCVCGATVVKATLRNVEQ